MAIKDFRDSTGREWRVWGVVPDDLDPRTRDEDYLAQLYHTGWMVFETVSGDDKRRLYPVPKGWEQLPVAELEVLLQKAEVVPPRKLRSEKRVGDAAAQELRKAADFSERAVDTPERVQGFAREETPDVTDLRVARSFRYPGGRIWSACVVEQPAEGGPAVLRFTASARYLDLRDWPKDWADYEDEALAGLLRRAAPRKTPGVPPPGVAPRRWDDQPRA